MGEGLLAAVVSVKSHDRTIVPSKGQRTVAPPSSSSASPSSSRAGICVCFFGCVVCLRRRARRDWERERERVLVSEASVAEDSVMVSFTGGGGPFLGLVSLSDMITGWMIYGRFEAKLKLQDTSKEGPTRGL